MRTLFLCCCFFTCSLTAQVQTLKVYAPQEPLQQESFSWLVFVENKKKADVFIDKVCNSNTCSYRILSSTDSASIELKGIERMDESKKLIPVLAKLFSEKIQKNTLNYDISEEFDNNFHRTGRFKDFWIFSATGDLSYYKSGYRQKEPYNSPISDVFSRKSFQMSGNIARVSEISRFSANIRIDPRKKDLIHSNLSGSAFFATKIYKNFSMGFFGRYFLRWPNPVSFGKAVNITLSPNVEYNFFPLKDYYKKHFSIRYGTSAFFWNKFYGVVNWQPKRFSDLSHYYALSYFKATNKWYFSGDISHSFRYSKEYNGNEIYALSRVGINLGRQIWVSSLFEFAFGQNKNYQGETSTRSFGMRSRLELNYYFGNQGRNILNPQVY